MLAVTVCALADSRMPVWRRIWPVPALRELPRVKGWAVLRVILPPFEAMEAEEEMAPPAFKTSGSGPPLALIAPLIARSRTALSVSVKLAPAVLATATATRVSPLPVDGLAVLMVTAEPALSEVWMVALFATAEFAVGVNTLGLPLLKVPPLVVAVETVTSLAARRC